MDIDIRVVKTWLGGGGELEEVSGERKGTYVIVSTHKKIFFKSEVKKISTHLLLEAWLILECTICHKLAQDLAQSKISMSAF